LNSTRVIGIAGWSGSGKTTLITRMIPLLVKRGLKVATVKHAHHAFDVDQPGKDSYEHRKSGAAEVVISSARRWVQMHELGEEREPSLIELLRRLSPCDVVLVEGFKHERHAKLEVYRPSLGKPPLHTDDSRIIAIASDQPITGARVPVLDLNNVPSIAGFVCERAPMMEDAIGALECTP